MNKLDFFRFFCRVLEICKKKISNTKFIQNCISFYKKRFSNKGMESISTMNSPLTFFDKFLDDLTLYHLNLSTTISIYGVLLKIEHEENKVIRITILALMPLIVAEKVVKDLNLYPEIKLPIHKKEYRTSISFVLRGNNTICEALTEAILKYPDTNPNDLFLDMKNHPSHFAFHDLQNYDLGHWSIAETPLNGQEEEDTDDWEFL